MSLFTYRASDSSGRVVSGSMEAGDRDVLVKKLRESGCYLISVGGSNEAVKASERPGFFQNLLRKRDISSFTQELSTMLESGLQLERALSILHELEQDASFKALILELKKGIQGGRSFADCLEAHKDIFPEIYLSTVRAGEAGGFLEASLSRLKSYLEETKKLNDEIRSALIYPLLLTVAGGGAIAVMIFFVIPRFSVVFDDLGAVMPLPTRMLLGMSSAAADWWWAFAASAVAAALFLRRKYSTDEGRLLFDSLKLRLPIAGIIFRKTAVSRFSRTLGTLLQGGLPILDALQIAARTMGNRHMASVISTVTEGVRKGKGLAGPVMESGSFPLLSAHMLAVGEETGKLDEMLLKIADNYDREITVTVKRLLTLLEPAIILVMALFVGFIVISLLLAVFSLNEMPL